MKKISLLLATCAMGLILSGCSSSTRLANGLDLPEKEVVLKNKKVKVYYEDLTKNDGTEALKKVAKIFNAGFIPEELTYIISRELLKKYRLTYNDFSLADTSNSKAFNMIGYSLTKMKAFKDGNAFDEFLWILKNTNNKKFEFNFEVVGNKLISTEKFDNPYYVLVYANTYIRHLRSLMKKDENLFLELGNSWFFVLDKESLLQNKLAFKTVRDSLICSLEDDGKTMSDLIKEQITLSGFTLVDNPKEADKLVYLETLPVAEVKDLKKLDSSHSSLSLAGADIIKRGQATLGIANIRSSSFSSSMGASAGMMALSIFSDIFSETFDPLLVQNVKILDNINKVQTIIKLKPVSIRLKGLTEIQKRVRGISRYLIDGKKDIYGSSFRKTDYEDL